MSSRVWRNDVLMIYAWDGPLEGPWCRAEDVKRFRNKEAIEDAMEGLGFALQDHLGFSQSMGPLADRKIKAATPDQWAKLLLLVAADHAVSYNASVW